MPKEIRISDNNPLEDQSITQRKKSPKNYDARYAEYLAQIQEEEDLQEKVPIIPLKRDPIVKDVHGLKKFYNEQIRELFDPRIEQILKPDRAAFQNRTSFDVAKLILRYFMHHIGFYFLNILWLPVMLYFEGEYFVKNTGFWTWNIILDNIFSLSFIFQIIWLYIFKDEFHLPYMLTFITVFCIIVRSFTISVRYGFVDEEFLKDWKSRAYTTKELFKNLIIGFLAAGPEVLDREIWHSMQRNNMEDSTFHFCSVFKLDPELHFYLKDYSPDQNIFQEIYQINQK